MGMRFLHTELSLASPYSSFFFSLFPAGSAGSCWTAYYTVLAYISDLCLSYQPLCNYANELQCPQYLASRRPFIRGGRLLTTAELIKTSLNRSDVLKLTIGFQKRRRPTRADWPRGKNGAHRSVRKPGRAARPLRGNRKPRGAAWAHRTPGQPGRTAWPPRTPRRARQHRDWDTRTTRHAQLAPTLAVHLGRVCALPAVSALLPAHRIWAMLFPAIAYMSVKDTRAPLEPDDNEASLSSRWHVQSLQLYVETAGTTAFRTSVLLSGNSSKPMS